MRGAEAGAGWCSIQGLNRVVIAVAGMLRLPCWQRLRVPCPASHLLLPTRQASRAASKCACRQAAAPHLSAHLRLHTPGSPAGILSGIKKGMLARAGASIRMQGGCLDLLKKACQAGVPT